MRFVLRRSAAAAAVVVLSTVGLAACGSSSSGGNQAVSPGSGSTNMPTSSSPPSSSGVDTKAANLVPPAFRAKGTLDIGTDSTYAPSEFVAADGHTIVGFDVDLFNAVAAKLGLKTHWETASFGSIITGVDAGKYDIGVSSFTITSQREQQAVMVSYFSAGTQWATKTGNPTGISPDNACGKHVAVQTNTVEVTDLKARSKKCQQEGKPAIGIDQYTAQNAATAAAVAGKDDAVLADSPVMAYAVKQTHGQLQLLGNIYASAPYGYVLAKGQTQFGKAIVMALKDVMQDGTYANVLKKWGVSPGAITNPQVDPHVAG